MRETTVNEIARLDAAVDADAAERPFHMDEDSFRLLYDRTARPLWSYLSRLTGDPRTADDLLQETYYRFLRADPALADDAHRKNYLFRIATNLANDARRRPRLETADDIERGDERGGDQHERAARRLDVSRAMTKLRPRDRAMVWLAYVNGSSHEEIAETLGLKTASIKMLLFRARRRLASLLGEGRS
ncbi:MAG TPA: RNA polymerase sigma factor [Vicinamibacterales bacterium]|nr:RNA polymerase sigma factor [Vicinamibacterales bacterium]